MNNYKNAIKILGKLTPTQAMLVCVELAATRPKALVEAFKATEISNWEILARAKKAQGLKIEAIKLVRANRNVSLKEAVDVVNGWE